MNATQSYGPPPPGAHPGYMDHGHPHSSGPAYGHYGQQPVLPPAMNTYTHGYYAYPQALSSAPPPTSHYAPPPMHSGMLPPTMPSSAPPNSAPPSYGPGHQPDTTGQVAPPNAKPKLTGTVWEDEGTVCFQVEVRGICVARREDNCFINGTKLLNVANMTRGRRDGILKSEKVKNVVKIGPMHLKGVWIPFERALEFANKEKITEALYPLFVSNISPLLAPQYAQGLPTGGARRNTTSSTASQAQPGQQQPPSQPSQLRTPQSQTTQPPSTNGQTPTSIAGPHGSLGARPTIDRAHTFPTPPTSATSATGQANGGYSWDQAQSHPLHVDTGLPNTKSMPTTPTTTPPDGQYHAGQAYDARSSHYMPTYGHMQPPHKKEDDERKDQQYGAYSYDPHGSQTSPMKSYAPADYSRTSDHYGMTNGTYGSQRSMPQSNLAYVMSDPPPHEYNYTNAAPMPSKKRGREDDDDIDQLHKRKYSHYDGADSISRPRSAVVQRS
ncbi:MAG: hypothetical protein Q9162_004886 [Coniocarpon cinnabarinum]